MWPYQRWTCEDKPYQCDITALGLRNYYYYYYYWQFIDKIFTLHILPAVYDLGLHCLHRIRLTRLHFFCGSFMFLFCLVFYMSLCASVYMCFVVTCWERADLLALVCGVYCEFVTFPLVSWVRCGTWLYRFLIFAPLLTYVGSCSGIEASCQQIDGQLS